MVNGRLACSPFSLADMVPINLQEDVLANIERHFGGLFSGEIGVSSISGGQSAANAALAQLDITGYANTRSQVLP